MPRTRNQGLGRCSFQLFLISENFPFFHHHHFHPHCSSTYMRFQTHHHCSANTYYTLFHSALSLLKHNYPYTPAKPKSKQLNIDQVKYINALTGRTSNSWSQISRGTQYCLATLTTAYCVYLLFSHCLLLPQTDSIPPKASTLLTHYYVYNFLEK